MGFSVSGPQNFQSSAKKFSILVDFPVLSVHIFPHFLLLYHYISKFSIYMCGDSYYVMTYTAFI